jgi:hypothetical protein
MFIETPRTPITSSARSGMETITPAVIPYAPSWILNLRKSASICGQ